MEDLEAGHALLKNEETGGLARNLRSSESHRPFPFPAAGGAHPSILKGLCSGKAKLRFLLSNTTCWATVPGAEDIALNKIDKYSCLCKAYILPRQNIHTKEFQNARNKEKTLKDSQ